MRAALIIVLLTSTRAQLSMCGKDHSHAEPQTFKQSRFTSDPASVTVLNKSRVSRPISSSTSSVQRRRASESCVPSLSSAAGWKRLTAKSAEQRTNLGVHQKRRKPDTNKEHQQPENGQTFTGVITIAVSRFNGKYLQGWVDMRGHSEYMYTGMIPYPTRDALGLVLLWLLFSLPSDEMFSGMSTNYIARLGSIIPLLQTS